MEFQFTQSATIERLSRNVRSVHLRLPPVTRESWFNRFDDNEFRTMYTEDSSWFLPFLKISPYLATVSVTILIDDKLVYGDLGHGIWFANRPEGQLELIKMLSGPLKLLKTVSVDIKLESLRWTEEEVHVRNFAIAEEIQDIQRLCGQFDGRGSICSVARWQRKEACVSGTQNYRR